MLRRGYPLVIAAPSGAGKTSLARALVERHEEVVFSISATTRPARAYETDGVDYQFVSDAEFDRMVEAGELAEWAEVHEHKYGTPWSSIRSQIERGDVVVLDIDVQGARQIRAAFSEAVLVFILPPSAAELERRLLGRGSEQREVMRTRLRNALRELPEVREFDYAVVNDEFDRAYAALEAIYVAERVRASRIVALDAELERLSTEIESILEKE